MTGYGTRMNDQHAPKRDDTDGDDDDKKLAADSEEVSEFIEKLVEEPGAPMNEEGIINNP